MKNKHFGYLAVILMVIILIMTVIENRQDDKQHSSLETTITALRASDSIKGDSIKLLTAALKTQLESRCDTMTVEQRLKLIELQKYEVKMWNEKEKAQMSAYTQKEKANMSAYTQKEKGSMKNWKVYDDAKYNSFKRLSEKYPTEFIQYVIAEFWKDNSAGEDSYKHWEEFERIEKIPGVKEHVALEKNAYSLYGSSNKKLENEYVKKTKEYEKSYQAQLKELEQKYDDLIAQKKISLGL